MAEVRSESSLNSFAEKYGKVEQEDNSDLGLEIRGMISGKSKFEGLVSQLESIEAKITEGYKQEDFALLDVEKRVKEGIYFAQELKTNNIEKARLYFAKFIGEDRYEEVLSSLKNKKLSDKSLVELVSENSKEMLLSVKRSISKKVSDMDIKLEQVQEQYLNQLETIGKITVYKSSTEKEMSALKSKMDELQRDLQKSQSDPEYSRYIGKITQEMFKMKTKASKIAADYELCIMSLPSMENALSRYDNSMANIERYRRSFQEKELEVSIAIQNIAMSVKEVQFGTIKNFIELTDDYNKAIKQSSKINDYLNKRNNVMGQAYDSISSKGAKFSVNYDQNKTQNLNPFEIFEKARIKGDEYMGNIRQKSR